MPCFSLRATQRIFRSAIPAFGHLTASDELIGRYNAEDATEPRKYFYYAATG